MLRTRGHVAWLALAWCIAVLGVMSGSAVAAPEVPPGNSEIDQYVPTVPGSEGDKPLGGGGGQAGTPLSPSTADSLRAAGPVGTAALRVAEQTAPRDSGSRQEAQHEGAAGGQLSTSASGDSADESTPGAVLEALSSGDDGGMGILLPILLGVVAGVGAYVVLRRRLPARG